MMNKQTLAVDGPAVTVSTLCLIHCLVLPILATSLPILGSMAEVEWVHRLFVLIAVPLSLIAFLSRLEMRHKVIIRVLAFGGLACLIAGAFVEAFHDYETVLTVIGAIMLATAHISRIRHRRHVHIAAS